MTDHIPDAGKMVPERCEPPFELAGVKWFDNTHIMSMWDSWRRYIAEGGGASWPRDAFENLLDTHDAEVEALRAERDALLAEKTAYESPAWAANEQLNDQVDDLLARVAELEAALRRIVDGDHPEGTSLAVNGNYRELSARFQATARAALEGKNDG